MVKYFSLYLVKMKQIKIISYKSGKSYIFHTNLNISDFILKKQKAYDRWRRNKKNKYYDYYEIFEDGNFKSVYVTE